MRNRFTITVSDVYGVRQYSFAQIVKKFAIYLLLVVLAIWAVIAASLYFSLEAKQQIETQHRLSVEMYGERLHQLQTNYDQLLIQKESVESTLEQKTDQVDALGKQLQDLEEMVTGSFAAPAVDNLKLEERLRKLQTSTLGMQYLLMTTPSGPAVAEFKGITSGFGVRNHPVSGQRKMHNGMDYRGARGDEVIATAEGVVAFAAYSSSGFGKMVTLVHANGFKTRYGHLDSIHVELGEFVKKGQKLGEIGSTGVSTASHLHYEVLFLSRRLDPKSFHNWSLTNFAQIFKEEKQVPWASFVEAVNSKIQQVEKQLSPLPPELLESSNI